MKTPSPGETDRLPSVNREFVGADGDPNRPLPPSPSQPRRGIHPEVASPRTGRTDSAMASSRGRGVVYSMVPLSRERKGRPAHPNGGQQVTTVVRTSLHLLPSLPMWGRRAQRGPGRRPRDGGTARRRRCPIDDPGRDTAAPRYGGGLEGRPVDVGRRTRPAVRPVPRASSLALFHPVPRPGPVPPTGAGGTTKSLRPSATYNP